MFSCQCLSPPLHLPVSLKPSNPLTPIPSIFSPHPPLSSPAHTGREIDRETDRHRDRHKHRHTDLLTDIQTDILTDRQTDRHTDIYTYINITDIGLQCPTFVCYYNIDFYCYNYYSERRCSRKRLSKNIPAETLCAVFLDTVYINIAVVIENSQLISHCNRNWTIDVSLVTNDGDHFLPLAMCLVI